MLYFLLHSLRLFASSSYSACCCCCSICCCLLFYLFLFVLYLRLALLLQKIFLWNTVIYFAQAITKEIERREKNTMKEPKDSRERELVSETKVNARVRALTRGFGRKNRQKALTKQTRERALEGTNPADWITILQTKRNLHSKIATNFSKKNTRIKEKKLKKCSRRSK